MALTYLNGGRILGSSTFSSPLNTGLKEIGRYKVTGSSQNIISVRGLDSATSGSLANKKHLQIIGRILPAGSQDVQMKFNDTTFSSTAQEYATRDSRNGGSDSVNDSGDGITNMNMTAGHSPNKEWFFILNILNISNKEKFIIGDVGYIHANGYGSPPKRMEFTGKWTNTSSAITSIDFKAGTNNFDVDSEVIVLGMDDNEANSGTNFWKKIGGTTLGSAGDNITVSGLTQYNYLYVNVVNLPTGNGAKGRWVFNDETNARYTQTYQHDFGSESDTGSNGEASIYAYTNDDDGHIQGAGMYIMNFPSREKPTIWWASGSGDTTGAGTNATPQIRNGVGKYRSATAGEDDITKIDIINQESGDFNTGSFIEVYGAN